MVIPTYNRLWALPQAVESCRSAGGNVEIVVVDDGSTDDTAAVLARYGDRIRVLRKPNGGVSSARNFGFAHARGAYFALLDSDDEWRPTKIEKQVEFLEARPEYGMVLTDVEEMTDEGIGFAVFRRRKQLPKDGHILPWVLRDPALTPPSVMLRREVYEDIGGFDEELPTAEDLDFHLRVARRWPIGVIEQPLTRARRSTAGLSGLSRSCNDYLGVVARFVHDPRHVIDPRDRDAALLNAYARSARGLLWQGDVVEALQTAMRGVGFVRDGADARKLLALGLDLAKGLAVHARRQLISGD